MKGSVKKLTAVTAALVLAVSTLGSTAVFAAEEEEILLDMDAVSGTEEETNLQSEDEIPLEVTDEAADSNSEDSKAADADASDSGIVDLNSADTDAADAGTRKEQDNTELLIDSEEDEEKADASDRDSDTEKKDAAKKENAEDEKDSNLAEEDENEEAVLGDGADLLKIAEQMDADTLQTSKANRVYTVCLDPGHGGKDCGATNEDLGLREADLTHKIAYYCEQELKKYPNIKVVKTRSTITEEMYGSSGSDLIHRTEIGKENNADLFFCIHINSAEAKKANGVEVYYQNESYVPRLGILGRQAAQAAADRLEMLGLEKRFGTDGKTGVKTWVSDPEFTYPDGSTTDYLSILRNCKLRNIPSILIEHGFISNEEDCKTFFNESGLKAMGIADAKAIVAYFNTNPSVEGFYSEPDTDVEQSGSAEMYRMYNPNSGEHFYTANAAEKENLVKLGWSYEGIGWTAPAVSAAPVYRLYDANSGDHHYTMDLGEANYLIRVGWSNEGIGWYSDVTKGKALYRQYNPNAKCGSHNYTTNANEARYLVKQGWKDEGTAWYGLK
ncbi:MAG: N-acetylmuramoyl-L-alanine amidase [Eubacteriales bacterium]|nr:N-acetylmuramoyl-L-alanine amidase [Eubacteriales bacterium]